jgi:trans-aconitate methyltransferase
MVSIIDKYIIKSKCKTVLDLGCGSGLYGEFLKQGGAKVVGFDHDPVLCEESRKSGNYFSVTCADAMELDKMTPKVEAIFCSEFLEHMNNESFASVVSKMEHVAESLIIITVPNPLSPHFRHDPSHVLHYSIYSFLDTLNKSDAFKYRIYPIGFSETNLKKWYFRLLNIISSRISLFSPTVLYIGVLSPEVHGKI